MISHQIARKCRFYILIIHIFDEVMASGHSSSQISAVPQNLIAIEVILDTEIPAGIVISGVENPGYLFADRISRNFTMQPQKYEKVIDRKKCV